MVAGEAPIHWRLLTTHALTTLAQARQCIDGHGQLWHIEQMFRTWKRQGLDVESSLLETGERLEKMVILASSAALRTLQLTLPREGHRQRPARDAFTVEEMELFQPVQPTLEGKTEK